MEKISEKLIRQRDVVDAARKLKLNDEEKRKSTDIIDDYTTNLGEIYGEIKHSKLTTGKFFHQFPHLECPLPLHPYQGLFAIYPNSILKPTGYKVYILSKEDTRESRLETLLSIKRIAQEIEKAEVEDPNHPYAPFIYKSDSSHDFLSGYVLEVLMVWAHSLALFEDVFPS